MLTPVTADQIAAHFELGHVTRLHPERAHGQQGTVSRLDTTTGSWAVKELLNNQSEAEVHEAAAFQQAAHRFGVGAPSIIRAPGGEVLLEMGRDQVRVYEWVELADRDTALDPGQVGDLLALMHQVPFPRPTGTLDPWFCEPIGAVAWDRLSSELHNAHAPFASALTGLKNDLLATEALLEAPTEIRMCHRDLFADNLRAAGDGLCVIDWEDSGPADPSQELALVIYEFGGSDPHRAARLHDAYRAARGPGQVAGPAAFTMVIAQLGHITARACARWLTLSPDDPARTEMADLFYEFERDPLTVSAIDELLDAIRG